MPDTKTLFIDSRDNANLNADPRGSTVRVDTDQNLDLDKYKKVRVVNCTTYFTFPNVSTELENDLVAFTYNSIPYQYQFPKSTQSLASFNESLGEYLSNSGLPNSLIYYDGDSSSGKISAVLSPQGLPLAITWTAANNSLINKLFGFTNPGTLITATTGSYYIDGLQRASLNNINSLYISCSFCNGSSFNNRSSTTILDNVLIDVGVGSQIRHRPSQSVYSTTIGGKISHYEVSLLDDTLKPLDLNGEFFTVLLELSE